MEGESDHGSDESEKMEDQQDRESNASDSDDDVELSRQIKETRERVCQLFS